MKRSNWTRVFLSLLVTALHSLSVDQAVAQDSAADIESKAPVPYNLANLETAIDTADWDQVIKFLATPELPDAKKLTDQELFGLGLAVMRTKSAREATAYIMELYRRQPDSEPVNEMVAEFACNRRNAPLVEECRKRFPSNSRILVYSSNRYTEFAEDELKREKPVTDKDYQSLLHVPPGRSKAGEHYETAGDFLRQSIALDPGNFHAHRKIGFSIPGSSRRQEAIEYLLRANGIQPHSKDNYEKLGNLLRKENQFDSALESMNMAVRVQPQLFPNTILLRARIYNDLGHHDKAVEDLRDVLAKDHNNTSVRRELGHAALLDRNYPLSVMAYQEAFIVDSSVDALAKIGQCALELEQYQLAVYYIDRAIAIAKEKLEDEQRRLKYRAPSNWSFTRGKAKWMLGDKKAGADDLLEAFRRNPTDSDKAAWACFVFKELKAPHGLIEVARLWGRNENPEEAVELLKYVQQTWSYPVFKDHHGKRVQGHIVMNLAALSEINDYDQMPKNAYNAWASTYLSWSPWSAWLAVRSENWSTATRGFLSIRQSQTESQRHHGLVGMTLVSLHDGDIPEAEKNLAQIDAESFKLFRPTGEAYVGIAKNPKSIESISTFDLLGICGIYFPKRYGHRGLQVEGFLPGSLLTTSIPRIQARDLLIQVDELRIDAKDRVEALQKKSIESKSLTLLFMRGKQFFEVELDVAQARQSIQKAMTLEKEQ